MGTFHPLPQKELAGPSINLFKLIEYFKSWLGFSFGTYCRVTKMGIILPSDKKHRDFLSIWIFYFAEQRGTSFDTFRLEIQFFRLFHHPYGSRQMANEERQQ